MKNPTLKFVRIFTFGIMLVSGSVAGAQTSQFSRPDSPCSNRTLSGDYGAKIEGTLLGPNWPLRTLVLFSLDGRGNLTQRSYVVLNGVPTTADWSSKVSGTYSVNPDCTGSARIEDQYHTILFHFVAVKHGRQFFLVTDGDAITGEAHKVD